MAKLPTTFQDLDLSGFQIEEKQYTTINREMIDVACAVLQKNRVGIVTRSVQAALKHIYGIGGSADTVCRLLQEWRLENLAVLKQGRGEKGIAAAIMEATDDGLLEESDIPEDYLTVMRQMAVAGYRLAYQRADTSVSGERMKLLTAENDLMKQQLKDFPQLQLELNFYKSEYERQKLELKEAYLNLNKQQLADSEQFRQQLESLYQERNDLTAQITEAEKRLDQVADLEARERERSGEISRYASQLEAREREISALHSQVQILQASVGQKQVLESQMEQLRSQLKEANKTITYLQAQKQFPTALEVDVDIDELIAERNALKARVAELESSSESSSKLVPLSQQRNSRHKNNA